MTKWVPVNPADLAPGDRFKAVNESTTVTGIVRDVAADVVQDAIDNEWVYVEWDWFRRKPKTTGVGEIRNQRRNTPVTEHTNRDTSINTLDNQLTDLIAARLHQTIGADWHYHCGWNNTDDWGPDGYDPASGNSLPCGKEYSYREYALEVAAELMDDLDLLTVAFIAHRYAGSSSSGDGADLRLYCECGEQFTGNDFDDLNARHRQHLRALQVQALATATPNEGTNT